MSPSAGDSVRRSLLPKASSEASSASDLLWSALLLTLENALLPPVAVLANGLAEEDPPKPRTGAAVLRLELVLGFDVIFDFAAANGEDVPEPKEENGFTNDFELVSAGAGDDGAGE